MESSLLFSSNSFPHRALVLLGLWVLSVSSGMHMEWLGWYQRGFLIEKLLLRVLEGVSKEKEEPQREQVMSLTLKQG